MTYASFIEICREYAREHNKFYINTKENQKTTTKRNKEMGGGLACFAVVPKSVYRFLSAHKGGF